MDAKKPDKKEILSLAEKTKRYCDLLIEQSDSWLSEEEGVKNVERRMAKSSDHKKTINRMLGNKGVKILIGLLITFSFSAVALGQDVDNLFSRFTQTEGKAHLQLANQLVERIHELGHINKRDSLTEKNNPVSVDALVYGAMALYCSDRGNYADGIIHNEASLSLYRQLNDSTSIVHKLQNLYVNYASTGQFDKALNCLKESLEIATAIDDRAMVANTLLCMGSLHAHNMNDELAAESIQKGMEIYRTLDNTRMVIWALNSLSNIYTGMDRLDEAEAYIAEALALCELVNRISLKIDSRMNLALILMKKDQWDTAIEHLHAALADAEESELSESIILSLLHLGSAYLGSGKDIPKAESYLLRSVAESKKNDRIEDLMLAYDKLYTLHKVQKTTRALDYLEKSTALYKELQNKEIKNQLNNLHIQYQTAEKELEIERQRHVISRQNIHRVILFSGFVICLIFLVLVGCILRLRTKRNRMLAEMNATKDKFFSIISHDLKNPAIAQRQALQMLIDYANEWDTESLTHYYNELLKSADSQLELLYNLLNWAQVQTGRMPYHSATFDLTAELAPDLSLLSNMAKNKGVNLQINLPKNTILTADRSMLVTVVRNLLTNAIKFTGTGGIVSLLVESTGPNCTFTITDTGVGMSPEQLRNLFHIDNHQSRNGTSGENGNGLGLIVCKELVEKHGGKLLVESREGQGSSFRFTIVF